MTRSLRIARLGRVSLERLAARADGQGHVHSVFDRAINVLWHDGRLLTLHDQRPLAAPFAAALTALPPREAVTPGLRVRSTDFDWERAEPRSGSGRGTAAPALAHVAARGCSRVRRRYRPTVKMTLPVIVSGSPCTHSAAARSP